VGALGLGRVEGERRDPRIAWRLAWWVLLVAVLAAANYAPRLAGDNPPKDALYQWSYVAGGALQYAVMFGLMLAIAHGMPELFALRRPRNWKTALGGAVVVLVAVYILTAVLGPILHPGREQGLTPEHWDSSRAVPFFANAALVCLVAPFVEETMFRGVGFGLIRSLFGDEPAIAGSAVLFGLAHGLVESLPFIVALGVGLAWLRERQDSTIPGMFLHASFNAIALTASLLL
jgi:uncharacterized protein